MAKHISIPAFTKANMKRVPHFLNAKGELVHGEGTSKWTLSDWFTAVAGELGEAGNILKKIRRGDFSLEEARDELADELADTFTYLCLLAAEADIDLEHASVDKWNRVSAKIGYPVRMGER